MSQSASCKWREVFSVSGELELETTNPQTFVDDVVVSHAIREGLASVAQVESTYIDVDLSSTNFRRLAVGRLLAANIMVTYSIDIGGEAPASIAVTSDEVGESLASSNQEAINSAVADEIAAAKQGHYVVNVNTVAAPTVEIIIVPDADSTNSTDDTIFASSTTLTTSLLSFTSAMSAASTTLTATMLSSTSAVLDSSTTTTSLTSTIDDTTSVANYTPGAMSSSTTPAIITRTSTSAPAPRQEIHISAKLRAVNISNFTLTSYANTMAVAMNTSLSQLRIIKVHYAVTVAYTFDADVTWEQARAAYADANRVHRDNVTVAWTASRRLSLRARRLMLGVATIAVSSPEIAVEVQATASNGSALMQSLADMHGILAAPVMSMAPDVAVSVDMAVAVEDVTEASAVEVQVQSGGLMQTISMAFGFTVEDVFLPSSMSTSPAAPSTEVMVSAPLSITTSVAISSTMVQVSTEPSMEESGGMPKCVQLLVVTVVAVCAGVRLSV
jgi:hypothetical protein